MQSINVNIVPGDFPQILRYSQGDVGREFRINVVDFDIPTGATATIVATKPSGFGFTAAGTITDNVVSFVTTEDMTDEYGKFPAEVRITNGTTLLGTANFMFIGEKNPHPDGTVDGMQGTIIPELTLLVKEIRESNAKVESMTASAVPLPSGSDPTAEYNATDNNLEFGIPVVDLTDYATKEEVDEAITDLESELNAELDTKADAIIETASGSIASFTDGGDDLPMKSLKVSIVPKQSGSGDPSPDNIRPIEGWSGVNVEQSGKNLLDPTYRYNQQDNASHIRYYWGGASTEYFTKLLVKKGVTYTFSYEGAIAGGIYIKKGTSAQDQTDVFTAFNTNYITFTPTEDFYLAIDVYWPSNVDVSALNPILSVGSTATAYEPYQGESYSIPFKDSNGDPITVYGGTLNVTTGEMMIDRAMVKFSSLTFTKDTVGQNWAFFTRIDGSLGYETIPNILCDSYKPDSINAGYTDDKDCFLKPNSQFMVVDRSFSDVSSFISAMGNAELVYTLVNPITVQLEPTEIRTLKGVNNVWADTGDAEAEYRADTTLAFEKLKNAIVSLGGNI